MHWMQKFLSLLQALPENKHSSHIFLQSVKLLCMQIIYQEFYYMYEQ